MILVVDIAHGSEKKVSGAGEKQARAADFAPHALISLAGGTVVVVARQEPAAVDPQLPVQEMEFLGSRMRMCGIARVSRQAHQHADTAPLIVVREDLTLDSRRDLLPLRLGPAPPARRCRDLADFLSEPVGEAIPQGRRRTQHIGWPGGKAVDQRTQALQLALAISARGE